MNIQLREFLLGPYYLHSKDDDINYFDSLPLNDLERLVDEGFVEMHSWNDCPGVKKAILPFLERNPLFTAHGYSIDPKRQDTRITIEGVEREGKFSKDELIDFVLTFKGADDLVIDNNVDEPHLRCWYD